MIRTHQTISLTIDTIEDNDGWVFKLDEDKNNNKSVFRAGEEVFLLVRAPENKSFELVASIGSFEKVNDLGKKEVNYEEVVIGSRSDEKIETSFSLSSPADKILAYLDFSKGPISSSSWTDYTKYIRQLSDSKFEFYNLTEYNLNEKPIVFGLVYETHLQSWKFRVPGFAYFNREFFRDTASMFRDLDIENIEYKIQLELKEV